MGCNAAIDVRTTDEIAVDYLRTVLSEHISGDTATAVAITIVSGLRGNRPPLLILQEEHVTRAVTAITQFKERLLELEAG